MQAERGVLYITTGRRYTLEAAGSAASIRQRMPDVPVGIICDDTSLVDRGLYSYVEKLEDPEYSFFDRILWMRKSPFEKTLFLDSDTELLEPCDEIFELLERFDMAFTHAPIRWLYRLDGCPDCFPELNGGVIAYRRGEASDHLLARWEEIYRAQLASERKPPHDQPALRQALWESDARFALLPPEYNLRTIFPYFAGGNAKVKILHGRDPSLSELRRRVNGWRLRPRVGAPRHWMVRIRLDQVRRHVRRLAARWRGGGG